MKILENLMKEERLSVCSHGEDLDGLVSASLLIAVKPEGLEVHFSAPYEIRDFKGSYDIVLDLPPPKGGSRVLIDHHISNTYLLDRVKISVLRPEYPSTARVLYEILLDWEPGLRKYSELIDLTDATDSGKMDLESALFTSAVRKLFKERKRKLLEVCKDLLRNPPTSSGELVRLPSLRYETKLLIKEHGNLIERVLSLSGGEAILFNVRNYPSYLVPLIQLASQGYKLLGTLTRGSDGLLRLSLRSSTDSPLTALKLAEALGGGGHEHAAGALVPPSVMPEVLERIRKFLSLDIVDL
ncbi:MAG: DHHA1 domain-containing protein [Candidatus Korarchaeum sp.]|nr:DHHA1 domain-containing protein [Candidatus Korarchaeum sp.]MDW8035488.1 DHHA1 domain-containing protein [Candidatus Korarchaeum sp.]